MTTWTKDYVKSFLDTAFSSFKYRNVGLVVLMSYEWVQPTTMTKHLTWDSLDFEREIISIQQKRKADKVILDLSEPLLSLLKEQKSLWDFQKFVVPHHRASDRAYIPLSGLTLRTYTKEVLELARLPLDLSHQGVYDLAIKELLEAQVDPLYILHLTGLNQRKSLLPRLENTLEAARKVLEKRKDNQDPVY